MPLVHNPLLCKSAFKQLYNLSISRQIILIVNEAEAARQKYINVLVGSLKTPTDTYLFQCLPLESCNSIKSGFILQTVDDILRQLGTKRENFALLLTDTAHYMFLAGKTLKELHPTLMHVTCIAHLLHNCAMQVRANLKNIDDVVATMKPATIKIKNRKKDFYKTGLPLCADPVITRWATWLRAALYYSEYFPAVRTVVNNWNGGRLLVNRAIEATNVNNLVPNLVRVNQYRTRAATDELLEASDRSIRIIKRIYSSTTTPS